MKFGHLILMKILKFVATSRMSDFKAKMRKIYFGWGFNPDPAGGANSPLPDLAGLKGLLFS